MVNKIAAIVGLVSTIITLFVFIYTEIIYQKPLPTDEEGLSELKAEVEAVSVPASYDIEKIIVNLRSAGGKRLRFLDLSLHLIPFETRQRETLDNNKSLIHDSVIDTAGRMKPAELNSVAGKILFEDRVKNSINARLGEPTVKEILFSKFVVQ